MENKEVIFTIVSLLAANLTDTQRTDIWHRLRGFEMKARADEEVASAEIYRTLMELI